MCWNPNSRLGLTALECLTLTREQSTRMKTSEPKVDLVAVQLNVELKAVELRNWFVCFLKAPQHCTVSLYNNCWCSCSAALKRSVCLIKALAMGVRFTWIQLLQSALLDFCYFLWVPLFLFQSFFLSHKHTFVQAYLQLFASSHFDSF